jgi:hypothetical protein
MIQKQQAEQSKAGLQINLEYKLLVNPLEQGFSTFWYSRTPKSKLHPSAYPHPLCVPPNKKFYTNKLHLGGFFKFVYPCGLLAYPLWPLYVPLGVRVPQVENRWPRVIQGISDEINTFADCC